LGPGKMKSSAGFTLMELLIVMVIASIAMGIGLLSTQNMRQNYQLRTASRRVFADMQKVRLKAIKEGKVGSFAFDDANDSYTYTIDGVSTMVDLRGQFGVAIYNSTNVNFNGNGTAGSGGVQLQLVDHCQRVYVASSGTGNVRVIDQTCP